MRYPLIRPRLIFKYETIRQQELNIKPSIRQQTLLRLGRREAEFAF